MATLNKGERSILASFATPDKAKEAMQALKNAGYSTMQLDTVSKYPSEPDAHINNPITGQAGSLSDLTLKSEGGSSGDAGPLLAADPAASGMADGGGIHKFKPYLVTLVTNEAGVQRAVDLLKQHGAEV